jgi:uncharacterized protein (TIGR03083 family)
METNPRRWLAALRHSHDRLASAVQPLTPEQLRGPSYHDWSIAQVVSHMGSQAELYKEYIAAGVEGAEPPGRESMQPIWDAWNARSPEEQAADGLAYDEQATQLFEGLTDDQLARLHLSLYGMELGAADLAALRLAEHAVHTWDVAVALDPSALVAADSVALLIDRLSLIARYGGKPQGKTFRLHVRTRSPERDMLLQVGDAVELTEWADGPADGELRIPAEAFLRLVYGRLDPEHTPAVELTAQGVEVDDVRRVFPGI